jgi:hypothetical protein
MRETSREIPEAENERKLIKFFQLQELDVTLITSTFFRSSGFALSNASASTAAFP